MSAKEKAEAPKPASVTDLATYRSADTEKRRTMLKAGSLVLYQKPVRDHVWRDLLRISASISSLRSLLEYGIGIDRTTGTHLLKQLYADLSNITNDAGKLERRLSKAKKKLKKRA